ncbi:unnamed protein product [Allacma fusca]|uniref:Uncharacterized protein n=1 Tax=Allacma fusca TaxID=39272 RepID=A0A8J2K287_9HEXA|nr:unnamed protein product [Allacma fusca]
MFPPNTKTTMNSAGTSWIALIGATPVMLVILTWSITRQRNHETHILSRGNASKYIQLLKTILALQLSVQFTIFIYALLYKLLSVEHYAFLLVYTMQTLSLFKSLLSVSLVLVNSMSLSSAFVKYHAGILFVLSASIHVSIILTQRQEMSTKDFSTWVYLLAVHTTLVLVALSLILRAVCKSLLCFKKCSNIGCETDCSCSWRNKTCICLMILCVICSDVVYIATSLVEQFPEYLTIPSVPVDQASTILWAQVLEGILIVLLLDPLSQCRSLRKSQTRLVESPSSSYHLSDTRLNGRRGTQAMKFPITNGSLFASLTAVAMSRGNYMGGFDLKSHAELSSHEEDSFDKFKTYTKDVDLEETHSVTTIANDDFEFHHHIPNLPAVSLPSKDHVSLSLYESASMNDLDSVQTCSNNTRLYKKKINSKFHHHGCNNSNNNKNDKKVFRRVQSCESLPSAAVLERSYLDNGGYCEHYDEKVVFVTDFI